MRTTVLVLKKYTKIDAKQQQSAIRCNTPSIRIPLSDFIGFIQYLNKRVSLLHCTKGYQLSKRPIRKIRMVRFNTFFQNTLPACVRNLGITKDIALPTANKKKGNTRSVGVQPCQGACFKGEKAQLQLPGLLTRIMRATVAPLKTSSEQQRWFI